MNRQNSAPCQIWDVPTRVFHWLMALGFATCYLSGDGERWALIHVTSGYMVLGLIVFRLMWGIIGTRHARFKNFIRGPRSVFEYVVCLCKRRPKRYPGHNPAGALAILTLLLSGLTVTISGIVVYEEIDWPGMDEIHEISSKAMLAIVFIHVTGVIISSALHKENLIGAMITGCKKHCEGATIGRTYRWLGILMGGCVISFWLWSFKGALH